MTGFQYLVVDVESLFIAKYLRTEKKEWYPRASLLQNDSDTKHIIKERKLSA
jgi:hypothetical protein